MDVVQPWIGDLTYVLPIRRTAIGDCTELAAYLAGLSRFVPVIVVDGSPANVFAFHAAQWHPGVEHIAVDNDRRIDLNGKVAGAVTGLRRVRTAKAVIADDDVRYDPFALRALAASLDGADVVRPQSVFDPLPWHALLDTGRMLIARATGGDWPGTLGVRMDAYRRAGSYDGDVLFENLEFVRTLRAVGGIERVAQELYVVRRPPTTRHYLGQRVRQAYDEFARPARLAAELAVAPALVLAGRRFGLVRTLGACAVGAIAVAESGRRRAGGTRVFPVTASLTAPVWLLERAATSWAAVALRVARGGVRYAHGTLRLAANSERALRERFAQEVA